MAPAAPGAAGLTVRFKIAVLIQVVAVILSVTLTEAGPDAISQLILTL